MSDIRRRAGTEAEGSEGEGTAEGGGRSEMAAEKG
jgi:hypothetical protein